MAIVSCSECGKKLKVADTSIGKKVKCSCGHVFVASEDSAPAKPAPAASADKVVVACTECGAKLKVAPTSLGKKMKCPKCAAIFVAASLDAPKPKPKPKPKDDDDFDDLMSFAAEDAAKEPRGEMPPFEDDDEDDEEVKPKAKGRKGAEITVASPKGKPGKASPPPPPMKAGDKPVYPRRTVLNLFVLLLLLIYVGGVAAVFLGFMPDLGLPKWQPQAKRPVINEEKKLDPGKEKEGKIEGNWVIESATAMGMPVEQMKGNYFTLENATLTMTGQEPAPYTLDETKDPKWITLTGPEKKQVPAIYKIENEKLFLILPDPRKKDAAERPQRFEGNDVLVIVLRRATKEDSRYSRVMSQNNLKIIGLGLHDYHDKNRHLPPAGIPSSKNPAGKPLLSWRVAILPSIGEAELFKEFNLDESWDHPDNMKLIAKMPKVYAVPGVDAPEGMTHYRALVGPGTPLEPLKGPKGETIARSLLQLNDGTSFVFAVVEATEPTVWTKPDDLPYDPKGSLPKFGVAPLGFSVVMMDGMPKFVPRDTPENILRPYLTSNNGMKREILDPSDNIPKAFEPKDFKDKDFKDKDFKDKDFKDKDFKDKDFKDKDFKDKDFKDFRNDDFKGNGNDVKDSPKLEAALSLRMPRIARMRDSIIFAKSTI